MKSYRYFPLLISFLLGGIIRIFYALHTPLIETDGAVILLNARQFATTGELSLDSSLAALLFGSLYKILGEHLIIGKLLESFIALLTITIVYIFCIKVYNLRVAFLSSLILAFFPLHVIFSYLCKGYIFTSFLISATVFLLFLSIERGSYSFSIIAGITAFLSFFLRTFSIVCILGVLLWLLTDLFLKFIIREKISFYNKSLFAFIISSALCLTPFFIFRTMRLGKYFFRDFGMPDWLQSMEYYYRSLWENICDYHSIIYFIFIPSLLFFSYVLIKGKGNRFPNLLILVFALSYVILAIINPGHHFPRILVPVAPLLCIIIAVAIDSISNSSSTFYNPFLMLTSTLASIFYLYFKSKGPFNTSLENLNGIMKMTLYLFISYIAMALLSFFIIKVLKIKSLFYNKIFSFLSLFILILIIIAYSSRYTYLRTKSLATWINGYIQALKFVPKTHDTLLVYENAPFANLMGYEAYNFRDLEFSDGISMIGGDVEEISKKYFIRFFVVPVHEADDRIYFTYREMSRRATGKDPKFHSELEASELINRIYDNGKIVVFFYPYKETSPSPLKLKTISLDPIIYKPFKFDETEVYFQTLESKKDLKIDLSNLDFIKIYKNISDIRKLQIARENISPFLAEAEVLQKSDHILFPPNKIPVNIGDSIKINSDDFTLLSILKEKRNAYFGKFPLKLKDEHAKFSFVIENHSDREESYSYYISPTDLSIKPGAVLVSPESSRTIDIDFSLKECSKKKIGVEVVAKSTNRAYSIYFLVERVE